MSQFCFQLGFLFCKYLNTDEVVTANSNVDAEADSNLWNFDSLCACLHFKRQILREKFMMLKKI